MGVDKSNIRTVIHYGLPASAEAYIQEAGRGGRDGGHVEAILIRDALLTETRVSPGLRDQRQAAFRGYATTRNCRRRQLLSLMGSELSAPCSGCDVCDGMVNNLPEGVAEIKSFVSANPGRFSLHAVSALLRNPRLEAWTTDCNGTIPRLPCAASGLLAQWDERDLATLLRSCLARGILTRKRRGQLGLAARNALEV